MGMFSSLFGSAGSDKADRLRQQAIDAFNAIVTPELAELQVQLEHAVEAGTLTPEQAEANLLSSNAFNNIVTDPSLAGAQKQALLALQDVGMQGGLTAIDKARLNDIANEQNQVARGRNESILQSARQRGMGGSDITTVNQLLNEQSAADRAANRGTQVAADAEARALQALIQAGQTAGQIRGQEFGEQATKAQAENAIDLFNKQTLNQTNLYNVDAANRAAAANLANKQAISNANTGTTNAERMQHAGAVQQRFSDEMAKAQGVAGVYNNWANDAAAASRSEHAADQALLGGLVQTGATALGSAFGGPAGAVAGSQAFTPRNPTEERYDRGYNEGGPVQPEDDDKRKLTTEDEESPIFMNCGGKVYMNKGGETPTLPIKPGDDNKWTLLDPNGEIVGEFESYADAAAFAEKVKEKQPKVSDFRNGGSVPGRAPVSGDSPANDIVPARLSPGEVVVPRSVMSDDQEFDSFMEKFRPSRRQSHHDSDKPMLIQALQNLSNRVDRIEGR